MVRFLRRLFSKPEPVYRYITGEPLLPETDFRPDQSILDYFSIPFEKGPEAGFTQYMERKGRGWHLRRYHRYLQPMELGLFRDAELIVENDRRQLILSQKPIDDLDRQKLLDWVKELHEVFGPDAFGWEELEESDFKLLEEEKWNMDPFWDGRRWPKFENSPEFELKIDPVQGLTCTIWFR